MLTGKEDNEALHNAAMTIVMWHDVVSKDVLFHQLAIHSLDLLMVLALITIEI